MKIEIDRGRIYIDNQRVKTLLFANGTEMKLPFTGNLEFDIEGTKVNINGDDNDVTFIKNYVSPGSVINVKGDFRIGDG